MFVTLFAAMLAALVLITAIASLISGRRAVTHEWARCQHPVSRVIVSPSLSCLAADRRLLFAPTGQCVYRPRPHRSTSDVLVALLLLLGGVELNLGPTISARSTPRDALSLGVLNVRSARRKAALIHDVIDDHWLGALALTETWIPSDAHDAVKLDVCPPGYQVLHRHRGTSD